MGRRTLMAYIAAGLLLVAITALDLLAYPAFYIAEVYAVPLLIAALTLPLRATVVFAAIVLPLSVLSLSLAAAPPDVRLVRLLGVSATVYFAVRLAAERERSRRSAREAEEARQRTTDVLESITDAFYAVDPDWRFTYVNRAGERLLQRGREELIGRVVWEEFPEAVNSSFWRQYHRAVSEGVTVAFEEFYLPLGRWFEVRVYPSRSGLSVYFRDVTERKEAEEEREGLLGELRRRAAELEAVIESTQAQLALLDRDLNFLMVNSAYVRGSGHSREELTGRNHFDLFPNPENQAVFERVRDTGEPYEAVEKPFEYADQPERGVTYWNWVLVPIKGEAGRVEGVLLSLMDVTPQVEARKQIERLAEETRRRASEQEDLVRMVGHDLRNPLTSVQGQAQMLQKLLERGGQDGPMRRSAKAILVGAKRMNAMIQDLVDLARVESRQLAVHRTRVGLPTFVRDLLQRMGDGLDTGRVRVEMAEGLPEVWADADRLERVLTNLLSNGLKYSEAEVRVAAASVDGEVRVSVIDRGVGIPPEELPHVFEKFYRARAVQRKAEGLGLGLYITRMLVEAMDGRVWVESEVGKGSTFSFTLPAARGE
ncbi:MAG: sensor histidine kinase [Chloroflexota bacterium]